MKVKKINILFDSTIFYMGNNCHSARTGIYWTALNILKELSSHTNIQLYLFLNNSQIKEQYNIVSSLKGIIIKNFLSENDDLSNINIFFSPAFKKPDIINKYPNITCYTVLYDIIPLIFNKYFTNSEWFKILVNSLNYNDFYFSISDYTKKDFLKYFPQLDKNKIATTLLATNQSYKPNKDSKKLKKVFNKYNIPVNKKYLFSLCSLEPRKNLIRAVKCFIKFIEKNKINDLVYVLGGGAWDGFIDLMKKEIPELDKYKDKIIRAGYVADEDLEILYSNAEWFVYTSEYEGFGMPPLEAMSCECPVITSNNSSLPEVVGDAGIMIDFDSDEQHIAAYEKYYFEEDYRKSMAKKGFERSKLFSWKKCVDIMINRFEEVEDRKSHQPLVTIITPSYNLINNNRRQTFIQNLESVKNQTYKNIEHIVIDGASTDGTLELLKEYQNKGWIKYYSEPDKGIYDALNKGILKAKGKYVVCLNSDDYYCNNKAVEYEVIKLEESESDSCYADSQVIDNKTNKILAYWSGKCTLYPPFGEIPNHQTFMIKTNVMKELGLYNLKYKVSADSNFIYNCISKNIKFIYVEQCIVCYRNGGCSDKYNQQCFIDQENSFYEFFSSLYHLTKLDIHNLAHNNFLSLPVNDAIILGNKLENAEWRNEYFRRLFNHFTQNKTIQLSSHCNANISKVKCLLFNIIPLFKIRKEINNMKYILFGFIPLYGHKHIGGREVWKVLGLPIFKIRKMSNGITTKYYMFNIPVMKISRK